MHPSDSLIRCPLSRAYRRGAARCLVQIPIHKSKVICMKILRTCYAGPKYSVTVDYYEYVAVVLCKSWGP